MKIEKLNCKINIIFIYANHLKQNVRYWTFFKPFSEFEMSEIFFTELNIPRPKYVNNLIKGSHALETSTIMTFVEDVLLVEKPDVTMIYGDVNSTLAAAVTSSKLKIPTVHIEAFVLLMMYYFCPWRATEKFLEQIKRKIFTSIINKNYLKGIIFMKKFNQRFQFILQKGQRILFIVTWYDNRNFHQATSVQSNEIH